jgi:hypothetical protein
MPTHAQVRRRGRRQPRRHAGLSEPGHNRSHTAQCWWLTTLPHSRRLSGLASAVLAYLRFCSGSPAGWSGSQRLAAAGTRPSALVRRAGDGDLFPSATLALNSCEVLFQLLESTPHILGLPRVSLGYIIPSVVASALDAALDKSDLLLARAAA